MSLRLVLCTLAITLFAGCGPNLDPLDQPIDASSDRAFNRWLYRNERLLSAHHQLRFEDALKLLRLEMSVANPTVPAEQRARDLNTELHQSTAREFIAWVELLQINRLALENLVDVDMLRANRIQLGNVRPGSDASIRSSIENQIEAIGQRIDKRRDKIAALQEGLTELMPHLPPSTWSPIVNQSRDVPLNALRAVYPTPQRLRPPVSK